MNLAELSKAGMVGISCLQTQLQTQPQLEESDLFDLKKADEQKVPLEQDMHKL